MTLDLTVFNGHTPAPWEWRDEDHANIDGLYGTGTDEPIVYANIIGPTTYAPYVVVRTLADALLLRYAPELKEALQRVQYVLTELTDEAEQTQHVGSIDVSTIYTDVVTLLRSAIDGTTPNPTETS